MHSQNILTLFACNCELNQGPLNRWMSQLDLGNMTGGIKGQLIRKQIFLFSFEPKNEQNYFLISALASKKRWDQKNKGTLYQ